MTIETQKNITLYGQIGQTTLFMAHIAYDQFYTLKLLLVFHGEKTQEYSFYFLPAAPSAMHKTLFPKASKIILPNLLSSAQWMVEHCSFFSLKGTTVQPIIVLMIVPAVPPGCSIRPG